MKSVFIFRRDYRIHDNLAFNKCYEKSSEILPVFIFTPEQIEQKNNNYFSNNSVQFMIESLYNLNEEIVNNLGTKLFFFYGKNITILKKIKKIFDYNSIFFNKDYTPYAISRDQEIEMYCKSNSIDVFMEEDYILHPMGSIVKPNSTPYQIYTPFKDKARSTLPDKPFYIKFWDKDKFRLDTMELSGIETITINKDKIDKFYIKNPNILAYGGRIEGQKILDDLKNFEKYDTDRNLLEFECTHLSAYIKFGTISIREAFWKIMDELGEKNGLIDQLYWRECYYYIVYFHPKVLKGKSFNPKFNKVKWRNNENEIKAWLEGRTGYPVVDAGMRQLITTGYMHNRARLITSNFLVRILEVDWKIGEMLYAQYLTDYEPCINNGNWQWIASCGIDPKPHSQRVFNPWTQAEKFDKNCIYIKQWVPELKDVPNKDIFNWEEAHTKYPDINYNGPIVDYKSRKEESIKAFDKSMGK